MGGPDHDILDGDIPDGIPHTDTFSLSHQSLSQIPHFGFDHFVANFPQELGEFTAIPCFEPEGNPVVHDRHPVRGDRMRGLHRDAAGHGRRDRDLDGDLQPADAVSELDLNLSGQAIRLPGETGGSGLREIISTRSWYPC